MDEYYRAVRQLPSWLAQPLGQLPTSTAAQIHELRFRTGHGIFLTMSGRQVCLKELSECPQSLRECILDQLQLEEIFHTLCGGAVHAHQNELTQGFLTTPSGCSLRAVTVTFDVDGMAAAFEYSAERSVDTGGCIFICHQILPADRHIISAAHIDVRPEVYRLIEWRLSPR